MCSGEKRKILLVVPYLGNGGQEKIAVDTARCLSDHANVEIVAFEAQDIEYEKPCKVRYLESTFHTSKLQKVIAQLIRARKLRAIRKKEKPDIVYSFGSTANLTNALSASAPGKTVVAIHGFASVRKTFLSTFIFSKADSIICIAKAMQAKLRTLYPNLKKTVVIENGYDVDDIMEKSRSSVQTEKHGLQFIAVGRLEKVKGYDRLICAYSTICNELPLSRLVFVGDGSLKNELKALAQELHIEDRVLFFGYQSNPYAYLADSDIFVLSSHSEGFPNALIEALSCGLAAVSVDCNSGPREILCETFHPEPVKGIMYGEYGVLTENARDETELIRCLAQGMLSLAEDERMRTVYRAKASDRAVCFSLTTYRDKIEKLFWELING